MKKQIAKRIINLLFLYLALVMFVCLSAWAVTRIRSATIINSTLDSSPVGSVTPSTGVFSTLTDAALTSGQCVQITSGGLFANIPCPNFARVTSVCSTGNGSYVTCPNSATLNFSEPDTNYSVSCTGIGPSGFPAIYGVSGKSTTGFTVTIINGTSNGAQVSSYSEIDCTVNGS